MKRLNNKGYMLVEIILAFSLAMVVMFFMTELTIRLKNKNDDLVVKTLASTDQAIIYNTIMRDVYNDIGKKNNEIVKGYCSKYYIYGNRFKYVYDDGTEFNNIVNKYSTINYKSCNYDNKDNGDGTSTISLSLTIKMDVPQLPDENFDVVINYSFDVENE